MTMQQNVIEEQLSREELQQLRNRRTGLTVFQISWILAFVCLIIVNWQLRYRQISWPPPGVEPASPVLPTIATIGMLLSVWLVRKGTRAVKANRIDAFYAPWRVALGLAVIFVAVVVFEWLRLPYTGIYSDVFRIMSAFHGVHALVIAIFMGMIYRGVQAGNYNASNFWPVEGAAALWNFVVFAWILFYAVLYLI